MSAHYVCYRCGTSLDHLSEPWSRRDECPGCENHVHVCRLCRFYDRSVPRQCLEDGAEEVREKEKVNFCDWFKPAAGAFDADLKSAEERAKSELASLFGDGPEPDEQSATAADDLFKS